MLHKKGIGIGSEVRSPVVSTRRPDMALEADRPQMAAKVLKGRGKSQLEMNFSD